MSFGKLLFKRLAMSFKSNWNPLIKEMVTVSMKVVPLIFPNMIHRLNLSEKVGKKVKMKRWLEFQSCLFWSIAENVYVWWRRRAKQEWGKPRIGQGRDCRSLLKCPPSIIGASHGYSTRGLQGNLIPPQPSLFLVRAQCNSRSLRPFLAVGGCAQWSDRGELNW